MLLRHMGGYLVRWKGHVVGRKGGPEGHMVGREKQIGEREGELVRGRRDTWYIEGETQRKKVINKCKLPLVPSKSPCTRGIFFQKLPLVPDLLFRPLVATLTHGPNFSIIKFRVHSSFLPMAGLWSSGWI